MFYDLVVFGRYMAECAVEAATLLILNLTPVVLVLVGIYNLGV